MLQWVWPVPLLIGAIFAPESEYCETTEGCRSSILCRSVVLGPQRTFGRRSTVFEKTC